MAKAGGEGSAAQIEAEFESNKATVIELLIRNCMQVDTSIPRVVKGKFGDDAWKNHIACDQIIMLARRTITLDTTQR